LRGDQDATLRKADERLPRLSQLWLEAGYRGEDKGADWALTATPVSIDPYVSL
jgi:hypothetical protein